MNLSELREKNEFNVPNWFAKEMYAMWELKTKIIRVLERED